MNDIYGTHNKSPADTEVIKVLTTVSRVSERLVRKLTVLASHSKSEIKNNMCKMSDMSMTIEELCNAADAINTQLTDYSIILAVSPMLLNRHLQGYHQRRHAPGLRQYLEIQDY